jgi:RHS repeat-associated protein
MNVGYRGPTGLISELRYRAWGEVRYTSGTTPTKYTYTGQYSNMADFGLMFYNARWYDPTIGRFIQADSIVPGGVQGYDRYAYGLNNPSSVSDPSGHKPCWATAHYSCNLRSWGVKQGNAELARYQNYSSASQASVVAFLRSQGVSVTRSIGSGAFATPLSNYPSKTVSATDNTAGAVGGLGGALNRLQTSQTATYGSDESPNPPIYGLVATALAVHAAVMVIDVLAVAAEAALFYSGADAMVPELAVPLAITIGAVGVAALDFDAAFASYTYRVYANPNVHQEFILLPPFGLRVP